MINDLDTIRLSDEDYSKLPKYLYHITDAEYLDEIAEYGLGTVDFDYPNPFYNTGIFLALDYQVAIDYLSEGINEPCLMEIPLNILDKNLLYYDTNDYYTQDYLNGQGEFNSNITLFYAGVILDPSDQIFLIDI